MRNSRPCKGCNAPLRTNKPYVIYCQRCSDEKPEHKLANMDLTEEQKAEMRRLRAEGLSYVRIGQTMDLPASTPYRYLTLIAEIAMETKIPWRKHTV